MAAQGATKHAAKRTAFGDVSNTVNATRISKDDSSIASKPASTVSDKPTALSRPAQRPISVANAGAVLSDSTNTAGVKKPLAESKPQSNTRKLVTKRSNVVFKDPALPTLEETKPSSVNEPPSIPTENNSNTTNAVSEDSAVVVRRPLPEIPESGKTQPSEKIIEDASISAELVITAQEDKCDRKQSLNSEPIVVEPKPNVGDAAGASSKPTKNAYADASMLVRPRNGQIAPSEPEEYWEEEEEDNYDDDGYVTARSRGDNTTGGATIDLFPKTSRAVRQELEIAARVVKATQTIDEIQEESWDTSMVAEYGDEIFDYMRHLEVLYCLKNFMPYFTE